MVRRTPGSFLFPLAIMLLVGMGLTGCGNEAALEQRPVKPPATPSTAGMTIVAVGDSLTAGYGVDESQAYPARLQEKLSAEGYIVNVVNAGVSGETSSGTLSRIEWVIANLKPDMILLETGANDGLRGIDPAILSDNLDRIISIIKNAGIPVILCGMRMLPNLGPGYTRAFNGIYPEISRKHAIPLIPFFLEGVAGKPHLNQADRLHPTAEGYLRIVDHILPYVLTAVKSLPQR